MIHKLGLEKKIFSRQEKVTYVVLGAPNCYTITNTKWAQDVKYPWVSTVFFQKGNYYFDVLILKTRLKIIKVDKKYTGESYW